MLAVSNIVCKEIIHMKVQAQSRKKTKKKEIIILSRDNFFFIKSKRKDVFLLLFVFQIWKNGFFFLFSPWSAFND